MAKHFSIAEHSILSMEVCIIEKIHHHTNDPRLNTPFLADVESNWIIELGRKVESTKGVIRIRKSKERQYNGRAWGID